MLYNGKMVALDSCDKQRIHFIESYFTRKISFYLFPVFDSGMTFVWLNALRSVVCGNF